jgi:hypothetical protein
MVCDWSRSVLLLKVVEDDEDFGSIRSGGHYWQFTVLVGSLVSFLFNFKTLKSFKFQGVPVKKFSK